MDRERFSWKTTPEELSLMKVSFCEAAPCLGRSDLP